MAKEKKPKESYLKIPYHILNIRNLGLSEKVLLAHIFSFGEKGCWQSNATLAKIFMVTTRTISNWIASLVNLEFVQIKSPKGYYRTIWAKSHPEVRDAARLWYRKEYVDNPSVRNSRTHEKTSPQYEKTSGEGRKKQRSDCEKSSNRLGKNFRTTNNTTNKETIKETIAPPSPSPRSNGAQSALEQRRLQYRAELEHFCKNFGSGSRQIGPPNADQLEARRQAQLKSLVPGQFNNRTLCGREKKEHKPLSEKELRKRARIQKKALLGAGKKNSKSRKVELSNSSAEKS